MRKLILAAIATVCLAAPTMAANSLAIHIEAQALYSTSSIYGEKEGPFSYNYLADILIDLDKTKTDDPSVFSFFGGNYRLTLSSTSLNIANFTTLGVYSTNVDFAERDFSDALYGQTVGSGNGYVEFPVSQGKGGFSPTRAPVYYFSIFALNDVQANAVTITSSSSTGIAPEPQTWALMLAGLGIVGAALRRRRQIAPVALRTP